MIEKYGEVIVSKDNIVVTGFVIKGGVDYDELLQWVIRRVVQNLVELQVIALRSKLEEAEKDRDKWRKAWAERQAERNIFYDALKRIILADVMSAVDIAHDALAKVGE